MSAWIVSDRHIDVIVRGLCRRELVEGLSPSQIGRELWRENVKSIHYCYRDTEENDADYPGAFADWRAADADRYEYQLPPDATQLPALLLNSLASYEYQSCEHPGWVDSRARAWVLLLAEALQAEGAIRVSFSDPAGPGSWSVPWRQEAA